MWEKKQTYSLLEMIPPKENLRPFISMEHILSNIWSVYSSLEGAKNLKKKWWVGRRLYFVTFEIVSHGPNPRFFIRCNEDHRDSIRVAFYSQYPTMEFREIKENSPENYTKTMDWNGPDGKWNFYGMDEVLGNNDMYPIKTYTQFFETKPENIKDEKRVDPINTLLEGLKALREDEQIWLQLRITPVSPNDSDFLKRGKKLINKLAFRQEKKGKSILKDVLFEKNKDSKDDKEFIPPEMKLTNREREIIQAVEEKIGKSVFQTNIRCLYFGRNKDFRSGRKSLAEEYFHSFAAPDLNFFKKFSKTKTKVWHFFVKRRFYMRKRKIFRQYVLRETPLFPRKGGTFILNTEEVATIFHPPVETGSSSHLVQSVQAKKGEAPGDLPV